MTHFHFLSVWGLKHIHSIKYSICTYKNTIYIIRGTIKLITRLVTPLTYMHLFQ
jgi:hypothetical protein